jgi:thymidylate synthase (FAD)
MKIITAYFHIEDDIDGDKILKKLENWARNCYKSEDKTTEESARKFIKARLQSTDPHEGIVEHEKVTVRFVCDRGVSHEVVRHRIGSYLQESTRWCNYKSDGIVVIEPIFFLGNEKRYKIWLDTMLYCEKAYIELIEDGAKPEEARTVLPNSLKTEIIITYNLSSWRNFFRKRCSKRAHPQMRELSIPLLKEFQRLIPVIFDDIKYEE